ncbi:MAG: hypothetical protein AUH42_01805 [Gemmatimonadetes bacterium 13_1_40CM_70_11]|nr:MAG: hypothetical protein AUH42_01805 [Gemmatimonadetes bacterium 13_1_40CM_70_11]
MFRLVRAGPPSLSLALGFLAGLYAVSLTAVTGPGLEPDSMSYVGAAESLVRQGTLRVPWTYWAEADSTAPLSDFPPAFSVAIALPLVAGVPQVQAARWVMVLGFAVAIGVFAALAGDAAGPAAAALLTGLVLATPAVVGVNTIVMSEPLFLAVLALTLQQMVTVPERAWRYGMLASIGALVRYAGVALIGAAGLWALAQPGDWRARLRRTMAAGLPGIALQALWVARTDLEGGDTPHTSFDFYGGLWRTLRGGLGTVCGWLVPAVPAGVTRNGLALVIALLLVALWRDAVRARAAEPVGPRSLLAAFGVVAACYLGVLVYSRLMVGQDIEFDARILTPVFMLAAAGVAVAVGACWRSWTRVRRLVTGTVIAAWLALALRADAAAVGALREGGYGYESPDWQASDFAHWLRSDAGGTRYQLFTNDPAAAYFLTGRPARLLPDGLDAESVRAFAGVMRARHGAVLGFESYFDPVAPPESLATRLGLHEAVRFDYGVAWIPADSTERRP